MILPETFTANDVLLCCTSFRYQLRRSLFQVLNEGLRGVAGPAAWRDLEKARDALYDGSLDIALRNLDRAWRCLPQDAAALAPIYGRLLALEGRDYSAALGLLQRAADLAPHPDVAALIATVLAASRGRSAPRGGSHCGILRRPWRATVPRRWSCHASSCDTGSRVDRIWPKP